MQRAMAALVRITAALLLLLACSCSSSKKPRDPGQAEREAATARGKALDDAKPKKPYETRERVAYRPGDRCGQGPYRIETDSLRAHYGEQIVVYACGAHEISGNYRLTVERKGRDETPSERAFGFRRDNEACKGDRAAVVQSGTGTGTGAGAGAGAGSARKGSAGGAVAPPAKVKPTALGRVAGVPEQCKARSWIIDSTYEAYGDDVALDGHLVLDLWSDEPNDLEDLVFVIEKKAVVADMTVERWRKFQDAERAWFDRYRAYLDGEVAAGRTTLIDMKVKSPPPPPPRAEKQPPRPSRNARWLPGYWHYEGASFHWIAGLWQVPEEDVAKNLTVQAPKPPPAAPPVVEKPREPRPTATAVWAPGQWQWDGRAYVWVDGAWRIPPSGQHTWKPSGWSITAGGATFVPGGWQVRFRR